jgi:SAM-dependent methyltransferase
MNPQRSSYRTLRQNVQAGLRATRLLGAFDLAHFAANWCKTRRNNGAFRRRHPDFALPPLRIAFDAFGSLDWTLYRQMGLQHAEYMAGLIRKHVGPRPGRILEFGCGPARVIRHLPRHLPPTTVLLGCDYNRRTICWCRRAIAGVKFLDNNLSPPLDLPSKSLDAAYCISVFTHLSAEMQRAWRDELLRVLKPGGLLIFTTHGTKYRDEALSAAEQSRYDAGQLVTRGNVREGKKYFLTHHAPGYVREVLLKGLEILEFDAGGIGQDVWVVRKGIDDGTLRASFRSIADRAA